MTDDVVMSDSSVVSEGGCDSSRRSSSGRRSRMPIIDIEFDSANPVSSEIRKRMCLHGVARDGIFKLQPRSAPHWQLASRLSSEGDIQDASWISLPYSRPLFLRSGGIDGSESEYISAVTMADVSTGKWLSVSPLPAARHGHRVAPLSADNSTVAVFGGFDSSATVLNSCVVADLSAAFANLDKMTKSAHCLDFEEDESEWRSDWMKAMPHRLSDCSVCFEHSALPNTVVVTGGINRDYRSVNHAMAFDSVKNVWMKLPRMNATRHFHSSLIWSHSCVCAIGGWDGDSRQSVEFLDLRERTARKWQLLSAKKPSAKKKSLSSAISSASASERVPVSRSVSDSGEEVPATMDVLRHAHCSAAVASVSGGGPVEHIVCSGHREGLFVECNYVESFDPRNNQWSTVAQFCAKRRKEKLFAYGNGLRFLALTLT